MATKKTLGKQAKSKAKITLGSRAKESSSPPKTQGKRSPLLAQAKKTSGLGGLESGSRASGNIPSRTTPKRTPETEPAPPRVSVKQNTADRTDPIEGGQYDVIRQILGAQKSRIFVEAQGLVGDELNAEDALPDLGDRASAETDQNFTLRLRERGQNLVKKIDEAIERIDTGTFGVCEVCGGQIAMKRLTARPVTTLCIECKTVQERTERAKQ